MKRIIYLATIFFVFSIILYSCINTKNYPGKAEIVKIEIDESLQDSVMIYGEIYDCFGEHLIIGNRIFEIYTKEKIFCTKTDTAYFQMTIPAGKHTITCKDKYDGESQHMCNLNLTTKPNQKIKIKFLYGATEYF